jgi:hypothetical protein
MQKGKILDYWKSYARDVCPSIIKIIDKFIGLISRITYNE